MAAALPLSLAASLRYIPTFAGQRDVLLYDAPLPTDHAAVVVTGPKPDHVAYIIFTSSSMGRPKGGADQPSGASQPTTVDATLVSVGGG